MGDINLNDFLATPSLLMEEVLEGLAAKPKALPPKLFYDAEGSKLFDRICGLPEYYLTRTEIDILQRYGSEIAASLGDRLVCLIELGSGNGLKARLMIEALRPERYVPIDIAREQLLLSARALAADYPWLDIHPVCADYSQPLHFDSCLGDASRVLFFPGSTIGNFEPAKMLSFLSRLRGLVGESGMLVVGVDLKKEAGRIEAAYNDGRGVTAAFNLNVLYRLRREFGADVDPRGFYHSAFYNRGAGRVEMRLISRKAQTIKVHGNTFHLDEGETIHTENSYKYDIEEFRGLVQRAGYRPVQVWTDSDRLFSVHALRGV